MFRARPPRTYVPLEDYELEAWDGYAVSPRRRMSEREIDTIVFAGVVGVAAAGLIIGFWAWRRR
jgi:hypothetical protein